MSKTILYINDCYCQTPEQLKALMSSPKCVKSDLFRREILSYYRDGILEDWYSEHNTELNVKESSSNDDDLFIALYKTIVGNSDCPNFRSDFSKLGELIRCEIEGVKYPLADGQIEFNASDEKKTIRFVIKSLKADNNIRSFTIKDKEKDISKIDCSWKDKTKGKEHFFDLKLIPSNYVGRTLSLIEGNDNLLCKLLFKFPDDEKRTIDGVNLTFYYVKSMKKWLVRFPNIQTCLFLRSFIAKNSTLGFHYLSKADIERLRRDTSIWNKISRTSFWTEYPQYYDSATSQFSTCSSWNLGSERHSCLLIVKNIPSESV